MLIFSYIFAAVLEIVMTVRSYQLELYAHSWAYGFLLFLSLVSIAVENSDAGVKVRTELNSLGIKTEIYDTGSNITRGIVYVLVVAQFIDLQMGVILAYIFSFSWFLLGIKRIKEK